MQFDDGKWRSADPGVEVTFHDVWGASANDVFAVGDDGVILHYDGATWAVLHSRKGTSFFGVFGRARDDVHVVGSGGVILHLGPE